MDSRQRSWGVPIPAFYCDDCGKYVITHETTQKVVDIVEKEGSDAWWKYSAEELLPEGFTCPHCGADYFHKEKDIILSRHFLFSRKKKVVKNEQPKYLSIYLDRGSVISPLNADITNNYITFPNTIARGSEI